MNKTHYTPDGQHPEDAIYHTKRFINELTKVQETYFLKLVSDLRLNSSGEDWLFDYIHNSGEEGELLCFDEYLIQCGKEYEDFVFVSTETPFHNNPQEPKPSNNSDTL